MIKNTVLILCLAFFFTSCAKKNEILTHDLEKKEMIYSIKQAQEIDFEALVKQIEPYQVIFVGDHHNNKKTHLFFEKLLEYTSKEGYILYLANEWFYPSHDALLKTYTDNKIDSKKLKEERAWDKFTKMNWSYVESLYEVVKRNGGELYGMNIPKENREKISLKKFDEMSKEEKEFYDNLDLNVSAHKNLVMPYLKHCNKAKKQKSTEACEQRMYRVQVTWDTFMAQNVDKIAKKVLNSPKDKLFVFAGAFHVENNLGIPLRFSRLNNTPYLIISNQGIYDDKEDLLKVDNSKADIVYIYK